MRVIKISVLVSVLLISQSKYWINRMFFFRVILLHGHINEVHRLGPKISWIFKRKTTNEEMKPIYSSSAFVQKHLRVQHHQSLSRPTILFCVSPCIFYPPDQQLIPPPLPIHWHSSGSYFSFSSGYTDTRPHTVFTFDCMLVESIRTTSQDNKYTSHTPPTLWSRCISNRKKRHSFNYSLSFQSK